MTARSERTGWVAYITVLRKSPGRATFGLAKIQLPDYVSSLATATAAAERIVTTEYCGEARVQGLSEWEGGYLTPRWREDGGIESGPEHTADDD